MTDPGFLFGPGPIGHWDDAYASCPVVLRAADGYRMWYYGREQGFPQLAPEHAREAIPMGRSGLAISRDGLQWQKVPGPGYHGSVLDPNPLPGQFDSFQVGTTEVLLIGAEYRFYYQGGRLGSQRQGERTRPGFPLAIGIAHSPDGLHLRRLPGPAPDGAWLSPGQPGEWDEWYVAFPRVNRLPSLGYRLTYSGAGPGGAAIGVADSPDGLQWEKRGPVFSPTTDPTAFDSRSVGSRCIISYGGRYLMAYEAVDQAGRFRIGLAESDDLLRWQRLRGRGPGGALIDYGATGCFDEQAMGTPYLLAEPDGSLKLYYVGFNTQGRPGIGLLLCDGRDITRWERYQPPPTRPDPAG